MRSAAAVVGLVLLLGLSACAGSDLPPGWPAVPAPKGDWILKSASRGPASQSRNWELAGGDVEQVAADYLKIVESYDGHVSEPDVGVTSPAVQRREGEVSIRFQLEGGVVGEIRVSSRQGDGLVRVYVEIRQLDLEL